MSIKCYSTIINLNFIIMEKSKLLKRNGIIYKRKISSNCRGNPSKVKVFKIKI